MRKTLLVLLAVALIAVMALGLVACDPCSEGHTWGNSLVKISATCTEKAVYTHSCTVCGETQDYEDGNALGHSYSAWRLGEQQGMQERTCTRCDDVQYRDVNECEHHNIFLVTAKASDCTHSGNIEHYRCDECERLFADEGATQQLAEEDVTVAIDAANHDYGALIDSTVAVDCEHQGTVAHYECSNCHTYFDTDYEPLQTIEDGVYGEHSYGEWGPEYEGKQQRVCSVCGDTETRDFICEHSSLTKVYAKDPDCIHNGNTTYYRCKVCGKIFADDEAKKELAEEEVTIPADSTKHDYGALIVATTAVDCERQGTVDHYRCSICHKYFDTDYNELQTVEDGVYGEHSYGKWVLSEQEGKQQRVCSVCGDIQIRDYKCEHYNLTKVEAMAPDCIHDGNIGYYLCDECGNMFADSSATQELAEEEVTIPADATKHDYGALIVATTAIDCEHQGTVAHYECSICHKYFDTDYNELQTVEDGVYGEHSYGKWGPEYEGKQQRVCSVCGDTEIRDFICEHSSLTKVNAKDPDCIHDGNTTYYRCKVCGKIFADDEAKEELTEEQVTIPVEPTNHKIDFFASYKQATCEKDGHVAYWQCSICDKYFEDKLGETEIPKSEVIFPATGHDFEGQDYISDFQNPGKHFQVCKVCGAHSQSVDCEFGDWEFVNDEKHRHECIYCHYKETADHDYDSDDECRICGSKKSSLDEIL